MDRLQQMSVFVAVVEAEGFAGGARKMGMSPPAVTRVVAALEQRLGVKLLNRTTRFVRMTEAGLQYYEDAKRLILLANEADEAAQGINAAPQGLLTVTASVLFGRSFVMPVIVEYLRRYPRVQINALFVDRVVNMLEEGVDVAIRIAELPDSSYHALKVCTVKRVLCASPAYLHQHGTPKVPEDLAEHAVILARGLNPNNEIRFQEGGQQKVVKLQPLLRVSDNDSAARAAIAGLGITRLLNYQIVDFLQSGQLKIVLGEFESPPIPVHILHREGRRSSAKVRAFVDMMAECLRTDVNLN